MKYQSTFFNQKKIIKFANVKLSNYLIKMNLKLTRPLVFFDLETTGTDLSKDKIVEISLLKIFPDGSEEKFNSRVNPEIPIQLEASEVHGIYDIDVINEPKFVDIAERIYKMMENCDLGGFNHVKFDIPIIVEEFLRSGISIDMLNMKFVDVQAIFFNKEPRNLSAAYKYYCNKDLENAHSAEADTRATYEVLLSQISKYDNIGNNVEDLSKIVLKRNPIADFAGRLSYNINGDIVFNFGKFKDQKVVEVFKKEPSYYSWIMKSDFPLYTKNVLTKLKEQMQK